MSSREPAQAANGDRWTGALYALLWSALIALLVASPWLSPGYLFGTDWPGPRRFALPVELSSSAPLQVILAGGSSLVSAEAMGKLLVLGILFVAPLTAFHAVPAVGFVPRAAAASLYALNPFVYGRIHYGQLFLLGAYALLPWALLWLRRLFQEPGPRSASLAAVAIALAGMFSPHAFLIVALLGAALLATHLSGMLRSKASIKRAAWLVFAAVGALVLSSYWIIPLLAGRGYEGGVIAATGPAALTAYASRSDASLGLIPNLLGLYGFWAENVGRFASLKSFVPGWSIVLVLLLVVCTIGAGAAFWRRPRVLGPWVAGLLVAATIGLVLEMGVSQPQTTSLVTWLDTHFVIYRGMRDAGKWGALLVLVYSQLAGLGVAAILSWIKGWGTSPGRTELARGVAVALLLVLPIYYGNGLLFGSHGEIKPSEYPSGWYAADRLLSADAHPGRTLFLPWHEYMRYSFVQNQNAVVAPPAPTFFSVPMVVSADPEVPGIAPPTTPDQSAITNLVAVGANGNWDRVLAERGIKYILLAKELDWESYNYLEGQSGLAKVADFGTISLYRNTAFSP